MSMTVTLCDSPKSDNVCRAYLAISLSAEKAYYDGLTKASYSCQTVELGQPIRIKSSIKNLLKFNYGWIDYGDGFRYYFSIRDIGMVSESMSDISYDLDCLATAYNQIGITIPRATLRRFNGENPNIISTTDTYGKYSMPYNAMYYNISNKHNISRLWYGFVIHNSRDNKIYTGVIRNSGISDNLDAIFSGAWLSLLFGNEYQLSDVVNFAYLPCDIDIALTPDKTYHDMEAWISEGDGRYNVAYTDFDILESTPTATDVILDARGNVVYECPVGRKLRIGKAFLAMSVATISANFYLYDYTTGEPEKEIVSIPAETIDIYVDSWAEYAYRQRDYDNQLRQINAKSSLANTSNSAISGALTGAMAGSVVPGPGTAVGAVAGFAVGTISQMVGTGITYYYGNEQQKVTDAMYQKAQDTLSLVGNCNGTIILDGFGVIKCTLTIDAKTLANYQRDIETNGYYYDMIITDFLPSFTTNKKYAITADVEINGTIPSAWRDAIADRFSKGLIIEHD